MGSSLLKGRLLVAAITSVCSAGFLLFGYDQGVMSGVIISSDWLARMGNPDSLLVGTITAVYDIGAVIGAVLAAFTGEPLGRKRTLMLGSSVLIVGTIIMGTSFGRAQFIVGRVFTGIGIGYITSVTPVYQAEISEAKQRGWQVACQTSTMLFGLMLAYWINYGFFFHSGSVQWRFPLLFQAVFAIFILALTPFLPDTPRWLIHHGKPEEGLTVLARLRGRPESDLKVQTERTAISNAIEIESAEDGSWLDLFKSHGISANKRFCLALGVQFMQQMTGINIVTYYAPTLFQSSLNMSQQLAILMGCLLQVWYIIASFLTWYTIDRIGRRPLFISMGLLMCAVLVAESISVEINGATGSTSAAVSAVFWVFAFESCFTWGWMATVWVYPAEIMPLKVRTKGAALAAAADFVGNFIVVEITPYGVQNIGYKFYLVWAVLNLVNATVVWMFYPETCGLPLEAIDSLFIQGDNTAGPAEEPRLWHRLQWSVVRKAGAQVKWHKSLPKDDTVILEPASENSSNAEIVKDVVVVHGANA